MACNQAINCFLLCRPCDTGFAGTPAPGRSGIYNRRGTRPRAAKSLLDFCTGSLPLNKAMQRLLALVLFALGVSSISAAQFESANRVQIQVNVFIGSVRNPAPANLTVQLLNRLHSLEKEGHTDASGRVEFQTKTERKQLRVFGPGIEEHIEEVEIELAEYRKMVSIIVKAKPDNAPSTTLPSGTGVVSTTMLKVPEKAEKEFKKGSEALK